MAKGKFTPGPWHWNIARSLRHLQDSTGNCFAQVSMPAPLKKVHNDNFRQYEVYEANAKLIAAAPDLLEALKAAEAAFGNDCPDGGFCDVTVKMRKAIFKAESATA